MKKAIVMLACVLTIGAESAQENNSKTFELGCNIGMTTFTNYSGISLFQDATDSYSNWSEAIHLGYRINNSLFGIQLFIIDSHHPTAHLRAAGRLCFVMFN